MSDRDDGGQAFPFQQHGGHARTGMSLRDYFASNASDADVDRVMIENFDPEMEIYLVNRWTARYMVADAMLSARKEQK